jgi:hypothetical protein
MLSKLFGSDVYLSYTAAYTWQSNQTAHAMMGFTGTTLLTIAATSMGFNALYGLSFFIIPVSKDVSDLILDRARALSGGGNQYFPVNLRELVWDALTDTFFWSLGMVLALAVIMKGQEHALANYFWSLFVVLLVGAILVPRRYYLTEKSAFDKTGLPYYFRLPNFDGVFSSTADAAKITAFLDNSDRNQHFLIHGDHGSRKTTLCVGIGSGLTITRRLKAKPPAVRYISAARLVEELALGADQESGGEEPHTIFEADILIVDDLLQVFTTPQQPGNETADAWKKLLEKPIVWAVSHEADVAAWESWVGAHKPADMDLTKIALGAVQDKPVTPQYSILKLQWLGLIPLLGLAIPLALAAAAIWALFWCTVPSSPYLRFGGFGLALALIAEFAWMQWINYQARKSKQAGVPSS